MKNIVTRSLSGIVYVALIVGCLWWGPLPTAILFALFGVLAVVELHKIMLGTPRTGIALAAMALDGFIVALMAFMPWMFEASVEALLASLCVLFLYPLFRFILALYDKGDSAFADSAASLMAPFYIGLPMLSVSFLRSGLHHGLFMVLAMFVLIWLNDTGAYCVGSTLGRNRMFPRLSPKKSWEGFAGGLVFCVVASLLAWHFNPCGMGAAEWALFGVLVCILSTLGDLFESLLKRNHHIKDSGNLIPGHGGILDRIDSLLFVAVGSLVFLLLAGVK